MSLLSFWYHGPQSPILVIIRPLYQSILDLFMVPLAGASFYILWSLDSSQHLRRPLTLRIPGVAGLQIPAIGQSP